MIRTRLTLSRQPQLVLADKERLVGQGLLAARGRRGRGVIRGVRAGWSSSSYRALEEPDRGYRKVADAGRATLTRTGPSCHPPRATNPEALILREDG